ncbi:MAG: hypothetical protein U1D06_05955, partial [Paracoccaceae bacterium]|nr:hypothetical protein [Paracoccaceae bacterium]
MITFGLALQTGRIPNAACACIDTRGPAGGFVTKPAGCLLPYIQRRSGFATTVSILYMRFAGIFTAFVLFQRKQITMYQHTVRLVGGLILLFATSGLADVAAA